MSISIRKKVKIREKSPEAMSSTTAGGAEGGSPSTPSPDKKDKKEKKSSEKDLDLEQRNRGVW